MRKVRIEEITVPFNKDFSKNVWFKDETLKLGDEPTWKSGWIVVEVKEVETNEKG